MKFNEIDFTENNYENLLGKVKTNTIFYNEIDIGNSFTLWRHDVDFSIHRAYALANIEKRMNVKATYFLQLGSFFYNIFEEEIKELILNILSLGHQIGLHFDPTQYKINTKEDLEKYLNFEKNILENLFQVEIKVFSFHNPTEEILKYDDFNYSDMINTYAKYFKENVEYCSDSNGYWRYKRLEDFLNEKHTKIQVLTHPAWWQKEVISPRNRIQRCIDGRANNTAKKYDGLLDKHGRKNVK
ncbi:polysaccharide deacetylase family protein [Halarcobacter bivalviorum]|uniref:hypothetical protein n=1 Tax=Halarcobacter bivalviorum TaxID=663364 RepID=UPI00100A6745|nr:hypothetical protein [Halarcobacter bivalviorum]RXK07203.1 hypothetical protein CRU97_03595 [Halarcobacter bivalviorum]